MTDLLGTKTSFLIAVIPEKQRTDSISLKKNNCFFIIAWKTNRASVNKATGKKDTNKQTNKQKKIPIKLRALIN